MRHNFFLINIYHFNTIT